VTAVGGSFSVVAVPAQLYATTGSSAAIGWSAVASFAGLITGALGAGALADRRDRRGVLLAGQLALAAVYLGLWAHATVGGPLAVLLLLVAGQGLTFGAISTVTGAVLPRLVPPSLLAAANSLNSLVRYGGSILGPILAGLLIPMAGVETLYLCDAVALLAVLWAVFHLPAVPPASHTPASGPAESNVLVRGAAQPGGLGGGSGGAWRSGEGFSAARRFGRGSGGARCSGRGCSAARRPDRGFGGTRRSGGKCDETSRAGHRSGGTSRIGRKPSEIRRPGQGFCGIRVLGGLREAG
jgi:MFS family permease